MKTGTVSHWTAGTYTPNRIELEDYHGLITFDPATGLASFLKCNDYHMVLPHCLGRNWSSIGIAVCCLGGEGVGAYNFGKWPLMPQQIRLMCKTIAEIHYFRGLDTIRAETHAEVAIREKYWPDKWDLARITPGEVTKIGVLDMAAILRKEIRDHKLLLMDGKDQVNPEHFKNRREGRDV